MMAAGATVSREFFDLIKAIGEARSKQEEDRIITNEIAMLKASLSEPSISLKKMQEYIIRSLYVELLGHDASFAHFKAVEITNQTQSIKAKRLGYLACNLFLSEDDELMLLLINTIQKDLASPNILVVQAALHGVARLLTPELLPALLPPLTGLLQHSHASIRKKTVMCFHKVASLLLDSRSTRAEAALALPAAVAAAATAAAAGGGGAGGGGLVRGLTRADEAAAAAADDGPAASAGGGAASRAAVGAGTAAGGTGVDPGLLLYMEELEGLREKMCRALCDVDPSVMAASLHVIHLLAAKNPAAWRDIVPSLVSILKQIIDRKLPKDYEYHRVYAPWIQTRGSLPPKGVLFTSAAGSAGLRVQQQLLRFFFCRAWAGAAKEEDFQQIKLLALLGCVTGGEQRSSEEVYELLLEVLRRGEGVAASVGCAVAFEAVRTAAALYPHPRLLAAADSSVSRFLAAESSSLRYAGLRALAALAQSSPQCAAQHQLLVVDCLEDRDEALQHQTLSLLTNVTNARNVAAVTQKLLAHLRAAQDPHLRTDLLLKVTSLAERYSPDPRWFLQTIFCVLQVSAPSLPGRPPAAAGEGAGGGAAGGAAAAAANTGSAPVFFFSGQERSSTRGDTLSSLSCFAAAPGACGGAGSSTGSAAVTCCLQTAYALLQLVADGPLEDEAADFAFRGFAVAEALALLRLQQRSLNVSDLLMQVIAWVVGEFGGACKPPEYSEDDVVDLLCAAVERAYEDPFTKAWIVLAIVKLCAYWGRGPADGSSSGMLSNGAAPAAGCMQQMQQQQARGLPRRVLALFQQQQRQLSTSPEVQERCFRGLLLLQLLPCRMLREIFPFDASTEDIRVDPELHFLDRFVEQSIAAGGGRYIPPHERQNEGASLAAAGVGRAATASLRVQTPQALQLKFTPYAPPSASAATRGADAGSSSTWSTSGSSSSSRGVAAAAGCPADVAAARDVEAYAAEKLNGGLQVQGPRRWGPSGYRATADAVTSADSSVAAADFFKGGGGGAASAGRSVTASSAAAVGAGAAAVQQPYVQAATGGVAAPVGAPASAASYSYSSPASAAAAWGAWRGEQQPLTERELTAAALFQGTTLPSAADASQQQQHGAALAFPMHAAHTQPQRTGEDQAVFPACSGSSTRPSNNPALPTVAGAAATSAPYPPLSPATRAGAADAARGSASVDLLGLDSPSSSRTGAAGAFHGVAAPLAPSVNQLLITLDTCSSTTQPQQPPHQQQQRRQTLPQGESLLPLDLLPPSPQRQEQRKSRAVAAAPANGVETATGLGSRKATAAGAAPATAAAPPAAAATFLDPCLMHPLPISTEEVGSRWALLAGEASASSRTRVCSSCETFAKEVLQRKMALQIVEVIGDEAIAAARYLPAGGAGEEQHLFLHVQLKAGTAFFIVKASTVWLAQAFAAVCESL